jgi:hypothetical protein
MNDAYMTVCVKIYMHINAKICEYIHKCMYLSAYVHIYIYGYANNVYGYIYIYMYI